MPRRLRLPLVALLLAAALGPSGARQVQQAAAAAASAAADPGLPPHAPEYHLAWTSGPETFAPWRLAVLLSIGRQHVSGERPARVRLYTNTLTLADLGGPIAGLHVHVVPIDDALFHDTPLVPLWGAVKEALRAKDIVARMKDPKDYVYSHLTDALRYVVLWKHGGVYLDFDFIVLRPLTFFANALGIQNDKQTDPMYAKWGQQLNFAVAIFEKGHTFLMDAMMLAAERYDPRVWACVGPQLVTDLVAAYDKAGKVSWLAAAPAAPMGRDTTRVNVFARTVFYPSPWQVSFVRPRPSVPSELASIRAGATAVHVWTSTIKKAQQPDFWLKPGEKPTIEHGSLLDGLLDELGLDGAHYRERV